jgi:nicotinate-nucleotide adenylyltransferase
MGSDNLGQFARWERWRDIAELVPLAVYARPGTGLRATASQAARALARYRLPESEAESLAGCDPPRWVYLHGVTSGLSSSAIRARRKLSKTDGIG